MTSNTSSIQGTRIMDGYTSYPEIKEKNSKGMVKILTKTGDFYFKKQLFDQAISTYLSCLKYVETDLKLTTKLLCKIASANTKAGQYIEAYNTCTYACSLHCDDPELNGELFKEIGTFYLASNQLEDAAEAFNKSAKAYLTAGDACLKCTNAQQKPEKAIEYYKKGLSLQLVNEELKDKLANSLAWTYAVTQQNTKEIEVCRQQLENDSGDPQRQASRLLRLGRAYERAMQYPEAIEAYTTASQADPNNPSLNLGLSDVHIKTKDIENGIHFLKKAIEIEQNPFKKAMYVEDKLCRIYRSTKQHAEIIEVTSWALTLEHGQPSQNGLLLNQMAQAYFNLNLYSEALTAIKASIAEFNKPGDVYPSMWQVSAYEKLARICLQLGDAEEASNAFNVAAKICNDANRSFHATVLKEKAEEAFRRIGQNTTTTTTTTISR